ncbi:MAG: hypothetical protein KJ834_08175 [Alphaproteobacteria bacterium]|nr:hypothetical protein [Alphaproteobacteria bacterium]
MPTADTQTQADQINQLRADLATRYEELATIQRMILALETDLAAVRVQAQSAERAKVSAEKKLAQIKDSLSWRITRPLRAIRHHLRG